MTITYRNKFRDWLAFQAYCAPRNPVVILTSMGFFIFVTSQLVLPAIHSTPATVPLVICIIGFILVELALIAFILGFLAFITILPMIFPRDKLLYCQRTLSTGGESFFTESEYNRAETKWSVVRKLVRTRSYIFVFLGSHNAFVVPRSAFEKATHWDAFYEACKENKKQA
ncbi:MAG TPA: YcxB family protein [Verrucomicrobiae bacterium]|jgi:fatty acid desaturase|nr:YcxB family protein [Verrucomicrobiae bacterium]